MSASYSLCIYAPLQADLFAINLRKPLKSAWASADWNDLEVVFSDADIARADQLTPQTGVDYMRSLRAAGRQTRGWHFAQNTRTRYLTVSLPQWATDWPRLLLGLNILRQVLPTSGDGQPGYILAHRYDGPNSKTLGAVLLRHGTTKVVGPHASVTQDIIDHARPMNARIKAMAKMPKPHVVDQLDQLGEVAEHA